MAGQHVKLGRLKKTTDEAAIVRCALGKGLLRIEIWTNQKNEIVRFNLAFINQSMCAKDHGRVLGYDNAHGMPHRHFAGSVTELAPEPYETVYNRFIAEVAELKMRRSL